jgi:hypothetical protein
LGLEEVIQLANAESANAESANAESANAESANAESSNAESSKLLKKYTGREKSGDTFPLRLEDATSCTEILGRLRKSTLHQILGLKLRTDRINT